MLVKNRFHFLLSIVFIVALIWIGVMLLAIYSMNTSSGPHSAPPGFQTTGEFVDTAVAATITAKGYTDTPN